VPTLRWWKFDSSSTIHNTDSNTSRHKSYVKHALSHGLPATYVWSHMHVDCCCCCSC
jgi:hypothetical protein